MVLIIFFLFKFIEELFLHSKLHVLNVYNSMSCDSGTHPWNHHHNPDSEHVHHPQRIPWVPIEFISLSTAGPRQPQNCFLVCIYINGLIHDPVSFTQHNAFEIHSQCCSDQWYVLLYCWVVLHCMGYTTVVLTIHLSMNTSSSLFLAIVNEAVINIYIQVCGHTFL